MQQGVEFCSNLILKKNFFFQIFFYKIPLLHLKQKKEYFLILIESNLFNVIITQLILFT